MCVCVFVLVLYVVGIEQLISALSWLGRRHTGLNGYLFRRRTQTHTQTHTHTHTGPSAVWNTYGGLSADRNQLLWFSEALSGPSG